MITLAITHCNRLKYLKALIKSLDEFVLTYNPQTIIVDNGSVESGTDEYLKSLSNRWEIHRQDAVGRNWINDEYIAKNLIIDQARHDIILFLQDDAELVVTADHLASLIGAFINLPHLSMEIEGVRRLTVKRRTGGEIYPSPGVHEKTDPHFPTHGLFKTAALRSSGPYRVDWPLDRAYWGRSEDEYDSRLKLKFGPAYLSCIARVPCFVSVWNDPRGGYAFIRDNRRWGYYRSPVKASYYFPLSEDQVAFLEEGGRTCAFLDIAQPNGWKIAKDLDGEIFKYPQSNVLVEGPSSPLESSDDT
jgi:hypothetical protein